MNMTAIENINNTHVLKDTLVANKAVSTAVTIKRIEEKRIEWETTVYRTSNQALYAILVEC